MSAEPELVTVVEISDDANEDRWADAFWAAEVAARDAALASGACEDELTVRRGQGWTVVVEVSGGRAFAARVRTTSEMHRVELPRKNP